MRRLLIFVVVLTFSISAIFGQRKIANVPDLPGYVTLKCDFHMHTVFSDADVWPTVRIDEALREGLDAIAITDVGKVFYKDDEDIYFEVKNNSDIPFYLVNGIANAPSSVTLDANSITRIVVNKNVASPLTYDVRNMLIGEKEVLKVELKY